MPGADLATSPGPRWKSPAAASHAYRRRAKRLQRPRLLEIFQHAIHDAVDVLLIDVRPPLPRYFPRPLVVSRAHTRKDLAAVHHVRLEIDGGALVKPRCHQVPGIDVAARSDRGNVFGLVSVGWQPRRFRHRAGDRLRQTRLLGEGLTQ